MKHCRLRGWLIAIVAICILLAALPPLFRELRRIAQQSKCNNNLRFVALALHNYRDVWQAFPPAITYANDGTPMHSWRVLTVPFRVSNPLYDAYKQQEAWNGPSNRLLADEKPDAWGRPTGSRLLDAAYFSYRCPSAPSSQGRMITNYVMLIDDRPGQPNGPPNMPGSVPLQRGSDSTVIVIEIANSDIHWMEPRDVLLSELSFRINDPSKLSPSSHHGGACVAKADGSVIILDESMAAEYLKQLLAP